jgi:hypothetical protein
VVCAAAGFAPAVSPTDDESKLFVLSPTVSFAMAMEPTGRDRLTLTRDEAESFGTRGKGPCLWWRVVSFDHTLGHEAQATRDEAKAKSVPKERCNRFWY